jgi:hypothetical protein
MTRRPISRHQRFDRAGRDGDFRSWHITSFRCDERFAGYRDKADSGSQSDRRIYGFAA